MGLWLLNYARDGRVISDIDLTDSIFYLFGKLSLDLLLVSLMLLIHLLKIIIVILMLTVYHSLSSSRIPPLLRSLFLC